MRVRPVHVSFLKETRNALSYRHCSFHVINRPQPGRVLKYFMRLVPIGFAYGEGTSKNGARGTRDIEGKVTRAGASKPGGERVSIKKAESGQRIPETGMRKNLRALQNFKAGHEDQFCAE